MRLFWRQGYAATSIAELTAAMGINPPSLYGAFGDKERLFLEAVERYQRSADAAAERILAEAPTARAAIENLLRSVAEQFTCPDQPSGCMVVTAVMNCPDAEGHLKEVMARIRAASAGRILNRIRDAIATGELPADTDADALGAFFDTVLQGMTIQARDGASRASLCAIAACAMRAWPDRRAALAKPTEDRP